MKQLAARVEALALAIGGPGLFLVAFLDSSFLSLPEINDLLVIWMVTRYKERMIYYAGMSTLGSIAGCLSLYFVARKGGEAFLQRRMNPRHVARATEIFKRYGVLAILVPSLLPPPAPFKVFVLLAGVARMPLVPFVASIAAGRGFRYFGEGYLALLYGDRAIEFLHENGQTISLWVAGICAAGAVGFLAWRRWRTGPAPA